MTAIEALRSFGANCRRTGRHELPRLVLPPAAEQLREHFGAGDPPLDPDRQAALLRAIQAAVDTNFELLTNRQWRETPWVLWHEPGMPVSLPGFLDRLGRELEKSSGSRRWRNLIRSYLLHFNSERPGMQAVREKIVSAIARLPTLAMWAELHGKYRLFDRSGPSTVAAAVLDSRAPLEAMSQSLQLVGILADGGFSRAIDLELASEVRTRLQSNQLEISEVRQLLDGLVTSTNTLRFPQHRVSWANALLMPWQEREPTADLRQLLLEFFLNVYRDPRLHPQHWQQVNATASTIFRRWLARVSLDQFFDIISKNALDYHWRFRRQFWQAYLRVDAIDDAWIALGRDAQAYARSLRESGAEFAALSGAQASQSVMILRIGGLIISEWSHNGSCRAWDAGDAKAPRLMRRSYARTDFVTDSLVIQGDRRGLSHTGSEGGLWQGRLSTFIQNRTNIRVTPNEYMPR